MGWHNRQGPRRAQGRQRLFDEIRYFFYITNDRTSAAAASSVRCGVAQNGLSARYTRYAAPAHCRIVWSTGHAAGILDDIEGIEVCRFTDVDVVRHPLVQEVVRAYDAFDLERKAKAEEGGPGGKT